MQAPQHLVRDSSFPSEMSPPIHTSFTHDRDSVAGMVSGSYDNAIISASVPVAGVQSNLECPLMTGQGS
jgi:hypothetical protein